MSSRRMGCMVLAAIAACAASGADAQTRYLMRERIVGLPKTSSAAAPPKAVATQCGDFTRYRVQSGSGSPTASMAGVMTYDRGQAFCLSEAKKASTIGTCVWDLGPRSATAYTVWFYPDAGIQTSASADMYAGVCS